MFQYLFKVSEDDGLPKMICRNCDDQLDHIYRFKKRCLATDVRLRQLVTIPRFRSDLFETPDTNILVMYVVIVLLINIHSCKLI